MGPWRFARMEEVIRRPGGNPAGPIVDTAVVTYIGRMFGPLNGVRVALVAAAAVAALIAAAQGQWVVTLVLGLGVAVHGAGWWYLYQRVQRERQTDAARRSVNT